MVRIFCGLSKLTEEQKNILENYSVTEVTEPYLADALAGCLCNVPSFNMYCHNEETYYYLPNSNEVLTHSYLYKTSRWFKDNYPLSVMEACRIQTIMNHPEWEIGQNVIQQWKDWKKTHILSFCDNKTK